VIRTAALIATAPLLLAWAATSYAQNAKWGSADDPTAKSIVASEAKWAKSACSQQTGLETFVADDFQGTSTDGHRTSKAEATAVESNPGARDCQLGDVKVRFFGESIAIAYGAESRIPKSAGGAEARRCQVWTDTWLKRNGQWQIIAAQDTVVPCNS
jgi:hypothetical protein